MKKLISIFLIITICLCFFASCGGNQNQNTPSDTMPSTTTNPSSPAVNSNVKIAFVKNLSGVGALSFIDKAEKGETAEKYNISLAQDTEEITSNFTNGDLDIASLPLDSAARLYNKTQGGISIIAITSDAMFYLIENGDDIKSIADLKGKNILTAGKGTLAEYTLAYILENSNLKAGEDVTIEYVADYTDALSKAEDSSYDVVLLPEPYATALTQKNSDFKIKINLYEEWEKITNGASIPSNVIAVRSDYLKDNKSIVDNFLKEYAESTKNVTENMESISTLLEKYEITKPEMTETIIKNLKPVFITGADMKKQADYFLKIIGEVNTDAIGGNLPDNSFYYTPQTNSSVK